MALTDPATALGTAALACVVSAVVLAAAMRTRLARRVIDNPNARSMHTAPTPRIGGLGVLAGIVVALAATPAALPAHAWVALILVAVVSAIDDLRGLKAAHRLPLHLAAAGLAASGALAEHGWAVVALATLAIGWSINLYNFMDGSDALAGTMGVIGFGTCAVAAAMRGDPEIALACAAIAGACMGFLPFNLPPARTFMGDLGSTSLGLLAGAIGAVGVARGLWSPWLPATAFLPFALDATATLLDRAARGCPVWQAHREHAYQRLNLGGLGHARTAIAYAMAMAVCAAAAIAGLATGQELASFLIMSALLSLPWLAVRRGWLDRSRVARARRGA